MRTAAAPDGAQNQLISIVAHELRNPLVPIRNAAALLRQDAVDADTVRRAAEIIERQVSGMQRLIGDLADVSRMQLGALELRRVRAPLSELIERAIESAGPMAADRGHSLSVSVSTQPIYLYMDVMRLGQALNNIICNASKYTEDRVPYMSRPTTTRRASSSACATRGSESRRRSSRRSSGYSCRLTRERGSNQGWGWACTSPVTSSNRTREPFRLQVPVRVAAVCSL